MANVWVNLVILRQGRLRSVNVPGMGASFSIVDKVVAVVDVRIRTMRCNAALVLTNYAMPVSAGAIIFWPVHGGAKDGEIHH